MELGGYGFEKPELLSITEEIYACKGELKDIEFLLDDLRFHQKQLPKIKNKLMSQSMSRVSVSLPLCIVWFVCFIGIVFSIIAYQREYNSLFGLAILICGSYCLFGGFFIYKILQGQYAASIRLKSYKNETKARKYCEKHNIITLEQDQQLTEQKIAYYEEQIRVVNERKQKLEERQQEILAKKTAIEDLLRDKGILFDEKPDKPKAKNGLSIKEEPMGEMDLRELYEVYTKEEQYIREDILRIDAFIQKTNKDIIKVDEGFELVKNRIFVAIVLFVFVAIVQGFATGFAEKVSSLICIVVSLIAFFYLESKCKMPLLAYLVEHDSVFTTEYAFRNDIVPLYEKREKLIREKEYIEEELKEIKEKKDALDF